MTYNNLASAVQTSSSDHPRRPWLAVLLTFLTPGLGHVYSGRLARGVILLITLWALIVVVSSLSLAAPNPLLRMATLGLLALVYLLIVADAWRTASRARSAFEVRPYNQWYVYVGVVVVVGWVLQPSFHSWVKRNIVHAFHIPSESMSPTILPGDYLYTVPKLSGTVRRSDIVMYEENGTRFLQRVVGLPGDTLEMRDKVLFVNGQPQDEPYVRHIDREGNPSMPDMLWQQEFLLSSYETEAYQPSRDRWGPVVVPAGQYFILGDNRDNSYDSRYHGFVQRHQLRGRPAWIYFSRDPASGSVRWNRFGHALN